MSADELSQPDMASNDESGPELNDDEDEEDRSPASPSSSVEAFGSAGAGVGQMMELRSRKCGLAGRAAPPFWLGPFLGVRYRALSLLKVVSSQACFFSMLSGWGLPLLAEPAEAGRSTSDAFSESTSVR